MHCLDISVSHTQKDKTDHPQPGKKLLIILIAIFSYPNWTWGVVSKENKFHISHQEAKQNCEIQNKTNEFIATSTCFNQI